MQDNKKATLMKKNPNTKPNQKPVRPTENKGYVWLQLSNLFNMLSSYHLGTQVQCDFHIGQDPVPVQWAALKNSLGDWSLSPSNTAG